MNDKLIQELTNLRRDVERLRAVENQRFVPLLAPLTSTAWDGDAFSTTAKTLIDLSAVFSAPAGIKAVLVLLATNDSASAGTNCYSLLSPNDTALSGALFSKPYPMPNDAIKRDSGIVPCNADGDIYYQISATGAMTFDVTLQIWGYWI